jgi:hypothetical protein
VGSQRSPPSQPCTAPERRDRQLRCDFVGRWRSGTIVDRVSAAPLSDHGMPVPMTGLLAHSESSVAAELLRRCCAAGDEVGQAGLRCRHPARVSVPGAYPSRRCAGHLASMGCTCVAGRSRPEPY